MGALFGDSNNFQPKRSVSEMYLIVKFKIILLASKGKFLFTYRRSCNILISALSECPQALSTSFTPARRLHLCYLKELQSSKKCSVSSMPSLTTANCYSLRICNSTEKKLSAQENLSDVQVKTRKQPIAARHWLMSTNITKKESPHWCLDDRTRNKCATIPFPSKNSLSLQQIRTDITMAIAVHTRDTHQKKYGTIIQMEFNTTGQKIKVKELYHDMLFFWGHAICMVNAIGKQP